MPTLPLTYLQPAEQTPDCLRLEVSEDLESLRGIAFKQEAALRKIYLRHGPKMLGGAHRALGSLEDANEVIQDWLVKVWERAATYDPQQSSVSTWLTMICRGLVANKLRSRNRRLQSVAFDATEELEALAAGPEDVGPAALNQIFGQFSDEERQYLDLAVFSPLTHEEIAQKFAQPLGTVKTRIRRALEKLKNLIQEEL